MAYDNSPLFMQGKDFCLRCRCMVPEDQPCAVCGRWIYGLGWYGGDGNEDPPEQTGKRQPPFPYPSSTLVI